MDAIRRWGPWLLLSIALTSSFSYVWEYREIPAFGAMQDDAIYLLAARSLQSGEGYRIAHLPNEPAQTKYPPLYPALLALAWSGQSDLQTNLLTAAFLGSLAFAGLIGLSFQVFRSLKFSGRTALLLTAAVAANPVLLYLSAAVMTEILFTALLLATLVVSEQSTSRSSRWAALAGLIAGLTFLSRTAALPLAVGIPLAMVLQRKHKHAVAFLAGMVPAIIGWQFWLANHPSNARDWVMLFYTDYPGLEKASVSWSIVPQILLVNFDTLLTGFGNLFVFMIGQSDLGHHLARMIGAAAVIGILRLSFRSGHWHYALYALFYCLLLLIWIYPPNERFTVPLTPLLLAGLWVELDHLFSLVRSTWNDQRAANRLVAASMATVMLAFICFFIWSAADARLRKLPSAIAQNRLDSSKLLKTFAEVSRRTPPDAVILSDQDGALYLHTRRHSYRTVVPPPMFYPLAPAEMLNEFARMPDATTKNWTHALVTQIDWKNYLDTAERTKLRFGIQQRPDLKVIYEDEFATLYQRANSQEKPLRTSLRY